MNQSRISLYLFAMAFVVCQLTACSTPAHGFSSPNGVSAAADGSLYVMDKGNYRIVHLTSEGKFLQSLGEFGVQPKDIYYGWDIQVGPDGNLYFCNLVIDENVAIADGVKVFSPRGALVRQVGWVTYAPDAETSYNPYALFVDSKGRVYIADYNTSTVRVFTPQGELLTTLFEDDSHELGGLGDIVIDEERHYFYIADFDQGKVEQFQIAFDAGGIPTVTHLATFGSYGRDPGELAFPQGLTVDRSTGFLYVGDQANRRIQVFDPQGNYVRHFAPPDVRDWQVLGLEFSQSNLLYAADPLNDSIWVFSPEGELIQRIEVDQ